jgi:para-aminobenzoate synthetase/4-amino-4-deoxychorismate lyase
MEAQPGLAILYSPQEDRWLEFSRPREIVTVEKASEVPDAIRRVEELVRQRGWFAAGFVTYGAAPGFDPVLSVRHKPGMPMLWFGAYDSVTTFAMPGGLRVPMEQLEWRASVTRDEYTDALRRIKERVAAGDTYQVNYTYRMEASFRGDAWEYFRWLAGGSASGYAAYLDTGRWAVCSASPELFFFLQNDTLESRPMKGTAPRGGTRREDDERARLLKESEKDRAENLMIVDMIRNDIGRVAEVGSVAVPRLCGVERFPTVLQMTSTVTATVRCSFSDIMTALFPCASITGAPKVRTMEIIAEVESTPRGLYTGCIGYIAPDDGRLRAQFNVAIRTVTMDRDLGSAEYGVGGGILWDSDPEEEYRECEVKTRILHEGSPGFDLLEAVLWTPAGGYYLLDRHFARLVDSAAYFDIRVDLDLVRARLDECSSGLPAEEHKVRIAVSRAGAVRVTAQPLSAIPRPEVQRVCFARTPVSSTNVHLYHKTTSRAALDAELARHPGCSDVILHNERGEVTESCTANVVADIGGTRITPPVHCGLLAGTLRAQLLDDGSITEGILTKESLRSARAIWLVNSVRKWMEAVLVEE